MTSYANLLQCIFLQLLFSSTRKNRNIYIEIKILLLYQLFSKLNNRVHKTSKIAIFVDVVDVSYIYVYICCWQQMVYRALVVS